MLAGLRRSLARLWLMTKTLRYPMRAAIPLILVSSGQLTAELREYIEIAVLRIRHATDALRRINLYIGDGATIVRPIVRIERRRHVRVGHASIATQLEWCARAGVRRAIFTHCGRGIVAGPSQVETRLSELGKAQHVATQVAYDGLRVVVR